jgi:hypothetical protein
VERRRSMDGAPPPVSEGPHATKLATRATFICPTDEAENIVACPSRRPVTALLDRHHRPGSTRPTGRSHHRTQQFASRAH